MCGEHGVRVFLETACEGSSPRVRGTHVEFVFLADVCGIIPACAGNTSLVRLRAAAPRDHPRVCGEHDCSRRRRKAPPGSSPRVRGTQVPPELFEISPGIIPACAGNTRTPTGMWTKRRDHPRVCGEHSRKPLMIDAPAGSSPRVRGTQWDSNRRKYDIGIIPACAGNTRASVSASSNVWDHPRVCGEHRDGVLDSFSVGGSSPRVRGTQALYVVGQKRFGIIPACAGNTMQSRIPGVG